ncbi:beta-2 adrenergic receptor-like [Lytechinus pictus]|uniref:beta-2 adrenergic receptor-like n=1 Tax=Lytechinus pictus TaxID=7653 RepID=UPI0030B9C769
MALPKSNCRVLSDNSTEGVMGQDAFSYTYATFMALFCLLCFIGNTLNLVVLRKLTNISAPRKVVFSFLSLSDFCTGIGWVPSVPAVVLKAFPFGRGFCVFCFYLIITNLGISIFLLLLVTFDCFIAVVYPYRYASMITTFRVTAVSVLVTIGYYLGMPILMGIGISGAFSDIEFYPSVGICFVSYRSKGLLTYSVYVFSYVLILFAILMTIMQGMVANVSRKQARRIAESEGRFRESALTDVKDSNRGTERNGAQGPLHIPRRRQQSELKGVLVCIAVSASFFVSWLPTAVWQIYTIQKGRCVNPAILIVMTLFSSSQCWINPFIYMIMKRSYREQVNKILDGGVKRCQKQHDQF